MRKISLENVSTVVDQLLKEISPLITTNTRSLATEIDGFKFHISFIDKFTAGTVPDVQAIVSLFNSPLCTVLIPLGDLEQVRPSTKTVIYYNIVSKMFTLAVKDLGRLLIEKIERCKQETIDIAFGHWVKLEIDPRARSGMRMSYGDDEGTLMSTPVDDPGQTTQYVITSLRGRGKSIPYVTPKDKTIDIDLSKFRWN